MLRLNSPFRTGQSGSRASGSRLSCSQVVCLLAVAGLLALAPAWAKDPAETESKSKPSRASDADQAESEEAVIPECLHALNLSQEQQEKITEIVRDYESDVGSVWQQFSGRYRQAIATEASLLAAIEDNLTEAQRKQVHEQRRKTAQHEKRLQGTASTNNKATAKPASAVEEAIAVVGVSLTPDQETVADNIQAKYMGRLRSLNRDVQGLHTRLVSLEADKVVEMEKILTKEQLTQLRESRQNAPAMPKISAAQDKSTKTE